MERTIIICPEISCAIIEIEHQLNKAARITKERGIKF